MAQRINDDPALKNVLETAKVIAVVGHSNKPDRTSYQIAQYLRDAGYKVYPVNPTLTEIDGETCYAAVADIPEPVDIVDVFRRAEFLPEVVEDAIAADAKLVWAQLGIANDEAAQKAVAAGVDMVMDRCIKIEHRRLLR